MRTEETGPAAALRGTLTWLFAAVALAATVEIALAAQSRVIAKDGVTFIGIAQQLARSPIEAIRSADQHPGYPALILAARRVIGLFGPADDLRAWVLAARLPAMLFGLLNVLVLWCWVRRAFDGRVAGVAAIFFAILPIFSESTADTMSDAPHLFFYLLSAWLITEGIVRRRFRLFPLAGVSSGLAYWIRPEGLGPVLVGAGVIALLVVLRREKPLPALAWLAGLLVAAGIVAAPYACLKGRLTSKKNFLAIARSESAEPEVRGGAAPPSLTASQPAPVHAVLQPISRTGLLVALAKAVGTLATEWTLGLRYFLTWLFAAGIFFPGAPKAQPRAKLFLAALAGFNILLLILLYLAAGYIAGRHTMPLLCVSLAWVGGGTVWLGGKLSGLLASRSSSVPLRVSERGAAARLSPTLIAGVLVAASVLGLLPRSLRPLHEHAAPAVQAARWIGNHAQPGDELLTNTSYGTFYSRLPGRVARTDETIPDSFKQDRSWPYRFVLLDCTVLSFQRVQMTELLKVYEPVKIAGLPEDNPIVLELRPQR
jgi:4-amino-4-deoxy-L-arabinose transferase-like glycosyltransferase